MIDKEIAVSPKLIPKDSPDEPWTITLTSDEMGQCPICFALTLNSESYCSNCGQKLKWEDLVWATKSLQEN